jgi:prevent-host-death family protein
MELRDIGIRELRQNASQIIDTAQDGTTYRVTNHGKDTGVLIGRGDAGRSEAQPVRRRGATPEEIVGSRVYDNPKPTGYEREMLRIVEDGRAESGRVGE